MYGIIVLGDVMKKNIELIIILLALAGLIINVSVSTFEVPINLGRGLALFRYYTLQSNLIAIVYFILLYFGITKRNNTLHKFVGGVTVYITITLIIFAIMLAPTYHPTGWNQVSNIVAHYIVPILVLFYFFYFRDNYKFTPKDSLIWIIYPVLYVVFMLAYGMITKDFLYPFFQVSEVGINGLIITITMLIFVFFMLSFLVMKTVSLLEKQKTT